MAAPVVGASDLLWAPARATLGMGRRLYGASARLAQEAAELPRSAVQAVASAKFGRGLDRQIWAAGGRAVVEVRGLDRHGLEPAATAAAVERRVARTEGILGARIDPATGRIAVRYSPDRHTLADLVAAVAAAEAAALGDAGEGLTDEIVEAAEAVSPEPAAEQGGGSAAPRSPSASARHAAVLAANLAGLAAAAVSRATGLPELSPRATALVALAEHQPWLRSRLDDVLGAEGADLLLGLTDAAVHGLSRNLPSLGLGIALRSLALRAERARNETLEQRAGNLAGRPRPFPAAGTERPVPLPDGPVERLAGRLAPISAGAAAAVLAGTRDPDAGGRVLLIGAPRAAHAARCGFVDALGLGLARRGVMVTRPGTLKRLDRITGVVIQSSVLHDSRSFVVTARASAEDWTSDRVWRAAQRLLEARPRRDGLPPGRRRELVAPPDTGGGEDARGGTRLLLVADGRTVGEVLVGHELDPLADAVLTAVRESGLRLALTDDATAAAFVGRADEMLRDGGGDPAWLRRQVRRLQADGQVVAVLGTDAQALDAADIGIGVLADDGTAPGAADVLCGPGLREVPRLLAATAAARETSERGVRISLGASFVGALLLTVGFPGRGGPGGRATLPVTVAALGALVCGVRAAAGVLRRPDPEPVLHTPWHALEPAEVLARLPHPGPAEGTEVDGAEPAAGARGVRLLRDLLRDVRGELDDPLTPVLATGAAASAVIGSPTDSLLVGGTLAGSALISGAQQMRADRALRQLLLEQRLPARVVDGDEDDRFAGPVRTVPAARLRPGHVIDLQSGDVVPADARLLAAHELEVDEATLTGESSPVGKELAATPAADLPDRTGMVYEGTTVIAGSGRAVVVAVGGATEAGRAMALAARAAGPAGMQHRLEELTRRGLPITLLGGAAVTALALLRGSPLRSALASGVSVAVAAVPEGLPLMATVAQLGAARRLSRRGVLVRASRTVEALGRVDTVCFDKTGTLTEGLPCLVRVAGLTGEWPTAAPEARRILRAAAHAGPAPDGDRPLAHATDQAVFDAARAVLGPDLDVAWEELTEIPFQSDRGFSAAVGRTAKKARLVVKGAPEVLLPRCSQVRDDEGKHALDRDGQERARAAVHALAGQGLRVLAVARRNVNGLLDELTNPEDVAELGDLTLLGFVGMADTARPQAAETVAALQAARVSAVMITGDHPVTARAIAGSLGIPADDLVTGPELAALEGPARVERVARASVFARVSPEQKLQIVAALQHRGRVVAMAGDGANDAAAIRLADVGIGMTAKGSTAARSAADLVFSEPDISLVVDALVEGRAMWRRVRDAVAVLLGGNVGEVGFTLLGTALAGHGPISTRQFLVVNMFTDLLPSMALALVPTPAEPRERAGLLAAGPPSLGGPLLRDIGLRGAVTALGALVAWQLGRVSGTPRRASTIALAALVGAELGQTLLLSGRDPLVLATGLGSAAVLAAIVQLPGVSRFSGCTPLGPLGWGIVLGCSAGATIASAILPRLLPPGLHGDADARRSPEPEAGAPEAGAPEESGGYPDSAADASTAGASTAGASTAGGATSTERPTDPLGAPD